MWSLPNSYTYKIFCISLFHILISCANSQNDIEATLMYTTTINTTAEAASTTITTVMPEFRIIPCGSTQEMVDECFKDLPPHLMEFLETKKIVINQQEITSKCTVFYRGMNCFEEYTKRCLSKKKLHIFKNNIEGVKNFFSKFCEDPEFQKDYLKHKDCFSYIQDDWIRCTKSFQGILTAELHIDGTNVTNKFMEFCCARYAYENCIYNSARFKCYKNSAKFARDTAKMLSDEKHFSNCRQYENALCDAATQTFNGCTLLLCLQVLIMFMYNSIFFNGKNNNSKYIKLFK